MQMALTLQSYLKMHRRDLGKVAVENGMVRYFTLNYAVCPCKDLYAFKENSSLLGYLQQNCKGWVNSPKETYTINYIAICLLAVIKEKGISHSTRWHELILCDAELEKVFKKQYIYLSQIRGFISKHLEGARRQKQTPPLLCVDIETVNSLLGGSYSETEYTRDLCGFDSE